MVKSISEVCRADWLRNAEEGEMSDSEIVNNKLEKVCGGGIV